MAQYLYRCDRCGEFLVTRPMGESEDEEPCPTCGLPSGRVYTPVAAIFSGDGFTLARRPECMGAEAGLADDPLCDGIEGLERVI